MGRREMFPYLESMGWQTPKHGVVSQLVPDLLSEWDSEMKDMAAQDLIDLVVYTDEAAHCGDGKVRVRAVDALRLYPDRFCCEHLATSPAGGRSLRYLQVGNRKWWLRYWSEDDWRSNVGRDTTRGWTSLCSPSTSCRSAPSLWPSTLTRPPDLDRCVTYWPRLR